MFTSALLVYASWQDIKTREIDERIFLAMGVFGVASSAYDAFVSEDFFLFLRMAGVAFGVALFMLFFWKLGFFGFADVEALVALSTIYPFRSSLIPFPLSVFNNAVLITALLPFFIFLYNIFSKPDLSSVHDKLYKKIALLFLGYTIPCSSLNENKFPLLWGGKVMLFVPLEYDFSEYRRKAEE